MVDFQVSNESLLFLPQVETSSSGIKDRVDHRPPRLVFITDNGKTLRFLDTSEIAPVGEGWAKWVKEGEWSVVQVWDGSFAPNGDM